MPREIRPLSALDVLGLSQFLAAGFQAEPGALFAAPEVLRWKYLQGVEARRGDDSSGCEQISPAPSGLPLSYIAVDDSGKIVGHLGLCRTFFEGRGIAGPSGRVETMHIIDWLGSPDQKSVGISLMRLSHKDAATQFGLGVSPSALVVGERAGYELQGLVPVYSRVLKPGYWLRIEGAGRLKRWLGLARHLASGVVRRPRRPRAPIMLEPIQAFGPEIGEIIAAMKAHAIFTDRSPSRLNTFLRFPRQAFTGWHLRDDSGRLRGFALLNVVPQNGGRTRMGKIVDCFLDSTDVRLWHGAITGLTRELKRQGTDMAQCYASSPWLADALALGGYVSRFGVKFHIRDPRGLIPRGATFHLTTLEGDYAYT